MANNGKILLSILGAAAAGVVVGMLIAPEKGEDLRRNLKKTAEDWMDEIAQLSGKGKAYASDLRDQALADAGDLQADAEEGVNRVKENFKRRSSSN
ncbi:MAG: hypothetical protein DI538_23895 [Azospira oryzae]|nr:MAG: hypothetical protein DI538_23895 [Azospira oryzae]